MNRSLALQGEDLAYCVVSPATDPFLQVIPLQASTTDQAGKLAFEKRERQGTGSRVAGGACQSRPATRLEKKLLTTNLQRYTVGDTMPRPVARTDAVTGRVARDEREEIERAAAAENMTVSDYVRTATLSYMALRGNKLAWKRIGAGMLNVLQDAARKVAALAG